MRPRKKILCFDEDEKELSIFKFVLETRGYLVLEAHTPQEAIEIFTASFPVDLVLVADYENTRQQLVVTLNNLGPHIPIMILGSASYESNVAAAMVCKYRCSSAELLERVKLMSTRKRGPKPGSPSALRCGQNRAVTA